jgi:Pyruvate/2-oxoacid:ferredoxin oxidoreductase delta subunit
MPKKRTGVVLIGTDHCKGCGLCIEACPTDSLQLSSQFNRLGYRAVEFLPDTGCTGCGVCFYACPEPAAITVYHVTPEAA